MTNTQIPVARQSGLVIQELPGEVLVYDLESDKAHCLNRTAAAVWKYCDGNNSVEDISKLYAGQSGHPVSVDLIWLAIDQLNESNLLEKKSEFVNDTGNRRQVIKKIGLAAVIALPLVTSLTMPGSAQAAAGSACNTGTSCTCPAAAATCTAAVSTGCTANCSSCSGNGVNNTCIA